MRRAIARRARSRAQVQWIDRGHERDEPLVSISTDGRVTQWSIAKGLEFSDLMALKRVPRKATAGTNGAAGAATGAQQGANASKGGAANGANAGKGGPASVGGEGDAFISRLTSGMSFDFSARDQRIYIAGTEDGWIHRCSTSYSEQYLESYEGHMGPIYALRWSPFRPNMWVSASADWTLRLWQEGRASALLNFQSGSHEVSRDEGRWWREAREAVTATQAGLATRATRAVLAPRRSTTCSGARATRPCLGPSPAAAASR